jgi:hypothetical protein
VISVEKPGSPEEILEHVGVKGMKWGVRNRREAVNTAKNVKNLNKVLITKTPKAIGTSVKTNIGDMSKKKKIAIGVGVGVAVVAGSVIAGHVLGSRGKIRISDIDGGKDNLIRLKNGKGAISTLSHEQWNTKISNAKASYKSMDIASKSIAARRKAGHPGYRPGEILGKSATLFNDAAAYPGRLPMDVEKRRAITLKNYPLVKR